jgi:hypothetical protein
MYIVYFIYRILVGWLRHVSDEAKYFTYEDRLNFSSSPIQAQTTDIA